MDGFNIVSKPDNGIGIRSVTTSGKRLEAQLALGPRLANAAYRIRYEAYHSFGFVGERSDGMFSDSYDQQANCRTAVIFNDGEPAATVRIAIHDPAHTNPDYHKVQAMEIFGSEIAATMRSLQAHGERPLRVVEIGKLARSLEHARDMEVVFALFRTAGYLILHADADIVFNAVRAHHMPMYRRFGFQQLEAPRLYPGLTFQTGLMACFRQSYDSAQRQLPFLRGISTADDAYAGLIAGERVSLFDDAAPPTGMPRALMAQSIHQSRAG